MAASALATAAALAVGSGVVPSSAGAAMNCVGAEEASAHAAGDSGEEGAPPRFTARFHKRLLTLEVSLDGADGTELPISIEEVCNVPKRLRKQASQLAGNDGVALLLPRTTVWQGGTQVTADEAATAIDGADTASIRGRLKRPAAWRADEDGDPVPTFRAGRIEITD